MSETARQGDQDQATILLVEDDMLVRMPVSDYLRQCGYKVLEAINALEATTILQHDSISIDIMFSNGEKQGFALANWIRRYRPAADVVLVGSLPGAANAAAELCDDGPLPRPYHPQLMVGRIRRLLASRKRSDGATTAATM